MPGDSFISSSQFWWVLACIAVIAVVIYLIYRLLRNPYEYPYFEYTFDVTNKRNINIEDYVDRFLCDERNWRILASHQQRIIKWKKDTEKSIENSFLRKYRYNQYKKTVDDQYAYLFKTVRKQTRYTQRNYVKTSYKVEVDDGAWTANWNGLEARHRQLEKINFECTINEYYCKDQRRRMTKELKEEIQKRDNYTCQICGKYMPDKVGLHVDHIVPISRGGKSIESNLRVLCSRCNGKKGAKYDDEMK